MTKIVPAVMTALSLLILPVSGSAEPGQGNGNGRGLIVLGEDGWRFCPPGLAGRDPACVPPGQARQAIADEEREQRRAQRRAERRAERAEARRESEQDFDGAKTEDGSEAIDTASLLAALLTPEKQPLASPSAPAQVTPVAEAVALTRQPAQAVGQPVALHEALERAAATGEVGF